MSLATLALVGVVALAGPLLAGIARWRIPVVIGQLLAGAVVGASGFRLVDAQDPVFSFLASLGFTLTMFIAGTHVPLRDAQLRAALVTGAARALGVGVIAAFAGAGLAALFGVGHPALYAVVIASSSAAVVLPAFAQLGLGGRRVLPTLAQVAVADIASIVALPLALDPARAPIAALGAVVIAVLAVLLAFVLRRAARDDSWGRLRGVSKEHGLALELRISLILLFGLAALATISHVSVLLAGFAAGLAVSSAGEPRRLARQLFGLTEGFLGPLYFVWLGASLSLSALAADPRLIGFGIALGVTSALVHGVLALTRQHPLLAVSTAAQLGVPVAAATLGVQSGLLTGGQPAALILGALVTIGVLAAATAMAARNPSLRAATGPDPSAP